MDTVSGGPAYDLYNEESTDTDFGHVFLLSFGSMFGEFFAVLFVLLKR